MPTKKPHKNGARSPAEQPKGVYFLSLSLENVRCFGPKQTLDLSDGEGKPARWTILLGNNGTGKTTVLQALAGLESMNTETWVPRLSYWHMESLFEKNQFNWFRSIDRPAVQIAKIVRGESLGEPDSLTQIHECPLSLSYQNAEVSYISDWSPPKCYGYGATRRIGENTSDDSSSTLHSYQAELRNGEEWLLQLDYAAARNAENAKAEDGFQRIKDLLLKIMPDDEVPDLRCNAGSGLHPKPKVEFQTPYGWVPLRQLGYGYQTLIAWMVDFASRMVERYPDSPDPLKEPAVVLVDEIDLHLHPTWQRKLIGFLTERFPNTQFIATAHSPLVVQAASGANFAVLRREGDHVVIDQRFQGIRNWSVEQVLTSELFGLDSPWPPQFDELLTRRTKLLEKSKLSKAELAELKELNEKIDALPPGKTAKETREILELTRKTQELLEKYHAQRQ